MSINQSSPGDFRLPSSTSNTNTASSSLLVHGVPQRSGRHDQQGGNSSRGNRELDFTDHPKEILQLEKSGAADFIIKTYQMLTTCDKALAEWSDGGETFTIKNRKKFAKNEIPKYFDYCNFASFSRQLHFYKFKKVPQKTIRIDHASCGHVKFFNDRFKRGRIRLLQEIKRSTNSGAGDANSNNQLEEVNALKRKVALLETQSSKVKDDFEDLKHQFRSLLEQHHDASITQGQDQTQISIQNSSHLNSDEPDNDMSFNHGSSNVAEGTAACTCTGAAVGSFPSSSSSVDMTRLTSSDLERPGLFPFSWGEEGQAGDISYQSVGSDFAQERATRTSKRNVPDPSTEAAVFSLQRMTNDVSIRTESHAMNDCNAGDD